MSLKHFGEIQASVSILSFNKDMIQGVLSEDRGKGSEQGRRCLCLGECALWSWRGEGYLDTHASVGRKFRSSSQVGQDATCVAICCIFKSIRMECDPSHLALPSSSISHHLSLTYHYHIYYYQIYYIFISII